MKKAIFLDRDGVINRERGDYTYRVRDFEILPEVPHALQLLAQAGFDRIVVTNQSGISQGLYTVEQMNECHAYMMQELNGGITDVYFSRYHPSVTESLSRKPGTLLFERALSQHGIDPAVSWMVGDRERDLIPARKLGMATIQIFADGIDQSEYAQYLVRTLMEATQIILNQRKK